MIRLMEEGARPRRRPAAEKLLVSTTTAKISRSPVRPPESAIYAPGAKVLDILFGYTRGPHASTFTQSAVAFENPDFVDVVIHCYRFHFGMAAGNSALQALEDRLAQKPTVKVPTMTIDGATDPLKPGGTAEHAHMFVGLHEHCVTDAGHNLPQQAPQAFADALIKVRNWCLLEKHADVKLQQR